MMRWKTKQKKRSQSTCVAWYLILKEKVCDILVDKRRDIREYTLDDELEDKAKDAEGR